MDSAASPCNSVIHDVMCGDSSKLSANRMHMLPCACVGNNHSSIYPVNVVAVVHGENRSPGTVAFFPPLALRTRPA